MTAAESSGRGSVRGVAAMIALKVVRRRRRNDSRSREQPGRGGVRGVAAMIAAAESSGEGGEKTSPR